MATDDDDNEFEDVLSVPLDHLPRVSRVFPGTQTAVLHRRFRRRARKQGRDRRPAAHYQTTGNDDMWRLVGDNIRWSACDETLHIHGHDLDGRRLQYGNEGRGPDREKLQLREKTSKGIDVKGTWDSFIETRTPLYHKLVECMRHYEKQSKLEEKACRAISVKYTKIIRQMKRLHTSLEDMKQGDDVYRMCREIVEETVVITEIEALQRMTYRTVAEAVALHNNANAEKASYDGGVWDTDTQYKTLMTMSCEDLEHLVTLLTSTPLMLSNSRTRHSDTGSNQQYVDDFDFD